MRKNIRIAREIDEGQNITQVASKYNVKPVDFDFQPIIERKWWFESLFEKAHLSFAQGALLIYAILVMPAIFFLPFILQSAPREFQIGYFATYIGSMTVIVILIPLSIVNKGLRRLAKQINESIGAKFVAPVTLIKKEDLRSSEDLKILDENYRNLYIKPIIFKTLYFGYGLSYNKRYQIGSGAVGVGVFSIIFVLRYVLNILPSSVFNFWIPIAIPEIATAWMVYSFFCGWVPLVSGWDVGLVAFCCVLGYFANFIANNRNSTL